MKNLLFVFIFISPVMLFSQRAFYNAMLDAGNLWENDKENYIKPLLHLEHVNSDTLSKRENNQYLQTLFTFSSFACDFEKALYYELLRRNKYYSSSSQSKEIKDSSFFDFHLIPARNTIDSLAQQYEVIMINESHHTPYHRNIIFSLLPDLKKRGFKYLALEALGKDHKINQRGYPCHEDGFYIREPLYAEMIREAAQLGFKLVSYEESFSSCDGKGKDKYFCDRYRDSIAAVNIYNIKKKNKSAKILVYAGYSHIKKKYKSNKPRMAEYFKRISGIDPLTIDQTTMMDFGDDKYTYPYYDLHKDKLNGEVMVLFSDKKNSFWSLFEGYDIMVFSPSPKMQNGRYSFYSINNTRKEYYLEGDKTLDVFFVQAFYENEKGNNIPADQTYFNYNKALLHLRPGKYRLLFYDKNGNLLKKRIKRFK